MPETIAFTPRSTSGAHRVAECAPILTAIFLGLPNWGRLCNRFNKRGLQVGILPSRSEEPSARPAAASGDGSEALQLPEAEFTNPDEILGPAES